MGWNYYLVYGDKTIHLGKSSIGWRFLFNFTKVLEFARDSDEFVWFKGAITNSLDNLKSLTRLEDAWHWARRDLNANNRESIFSIHTIDSNIIDKILSLKDVKIITEDENDIDVRQFLHRINAENDRYRGPISLGRYSGTSIADFS
jgi:hypothetical protein